MNTQTELTAIELFEQGLTKKDISAMAKNAITSVLEQGNVLQVAEALSAMSHFVDEVSGSKEFREYVREEVSKTPKGFISNSGAKIELAESGVKYDFSQCGDLYLEEKESELKALTEVIKLRKDMLKTVPLKGMDVRYNDELITVFPPSRSSTSSYKITLSR